mmetsp:Transcript_31830/g.75657  ORF Transcript_31830/g.75657 Transcript_31830/m.75657 type:complete len:207 (-) Transcript_31830:84-704(-)
MPLFEVGDEQAEARDDLFDRLNLESRVRARVLQVARPHLVVGIDVLRVQRTEPPLPELRAQLHGRHGAHRGGEGCEAEVCRLFGAEKVAGTGHHLRPITLARRQRFPEWRAGRSSLALPERGEGVRGHPDRRVRGDDGQDVVFALAVPDPEVDVAESFGRRDGALPRLGASLGGRGLHFSCLHVQPRWAATPWRRGRSELVVQRRA